MASPLRGLVSFQAGDETFKLSFSAEALYRLEKALGKNVNEISAEMQSTSVISMGLIRTLFWAGLIDHLPDLQLDDVGKIFSKISGLEATRLVSQAFAGAFTDGSEQSPVPLDPGQAAAGTGSES